MKNYILLAIIIGMGIFSINGFTSEEEYVGWDYVRIVTPGNKETGKILFEAKTEEGSYKYVSINVFSKKYTVSRKDLPRLKGFPLNSLNITHEAGYPEIGGHTVHFKLIRYTLHSKSQMKELLRISISKGRGMEIQGPVNK